MIMIMLVEIQRIMLIMLNSIPWLLLALVPSVKTVKQNVRRKKRT